MSVTWVGVEEGVVVVGVGRLGWRCVAVVVWR